MDVSEFLDALDYSSSKAFLGRRQAALATAPDCGHIFRSAEQNLGLQGVYTLRRDHQSLAAPVTPLVYVCQAATEKDADAIHRFVWNQDIVPFLFVHTPLGVKLYSGFCCKRTGGRSTSGVLKALTDFNRIDSLVKQFHAQSIDSGRLWRERGGDVTPETRVDWTLLRNLRTLDGVLQQKGLAREISHALIGKYVYLRYLRDRDILSNRKLNRWGIEPSEVFGGRATVKAVSEVVSHLQEWLNGSVFPIEFGCEGSPAQRHVSYVAGVFSGDEPLESGDRQLSLDFEAYDFSFIPIETLSNVYEQFLHAPKSDGTSRGPKLGAYYTPIPVVNMMLAELDERRPLSEGMRVLDPSCGSGAFLVQCYRRLIERVYPPGSKPSPSQLRSLLEKHIFGVDVEGDACSVTELSLILTLLGYVDPPDLEDNRRRFKLPMLRDKNIFRANFFALSPEWQKKMSGTTFDWIVGNPPWKRLNPSELKKKEQREDRHVWNWMEANKREKPVGGNQVARAFAWNVADYLDEDGEAALFLPAMTLFENAAASFRRKFFSKFRVNTVVNFSNLAEVLSAGRFRVPAAAFFYERRGAESETNDRDFEAIRTFCPLVANQETTRPESQGTRTESWSIVINASEIRDIPSSRVESGDGLPWKIAAWGSQLDSQLLTRVTRRFPSLHVVENDGAIVLSEGLQLRTKGLDESVDSIPEIEGQPLLNIKALAKLRNMFSFPVDAISSVPPEKCYARKGRAPLPLSVCKPPHILVSAARTFAVYSDEYIVVPPRQIGIKSSEDDRALLKALSLYLSSDFAFYHQFFTSTQFGVQRGRATLKALRQIPFPFGESTKRELDAWVNFHRRLVKTTPRRGGSSEAAGQQRLDGSTPSSELDSLLAELNDMVGDALGLSEGDRALVRDFVHVRLQLNDGKIGREAVRPPKKDELQSYAKQLQDELNAFVERLSPKRHHVAIVYDQDSGMVAINFSRSTKQTASVHAADQSTARALTETRDRLRQEKAQWVYFDRNLRIYEGTKTFILKPMQRFHWTVSQAMVDAREIIAEALASTGERS